MAIPRTAFELLHFIYRWLNDGGEQHDVQSLPGLVNREDRAVQDDLQYLHEKRLIKALPGDDRIMSIHGLTPAGRELLADDGI